MNILKNNKTYIFLLYINILYIISVVKQSYGISEFDYKYINVLIAVGMVIYFFYAVILKKRIYKIIFTLVTVSFLAYYVYVKELIYSYYYRLIDDIITIFNALEMGGSTYFGQYVLIASFVIPFVIIIMLFLANKGFTNTILIFNLTIMLLLWYTDFTEAIKVKLAGFIFISILTYGVNNSVKATAMLKKKGMKLRYSNKKIFYYIIPVMIITFIITVLPQNFKGKYNSDMEKKFVNMFNNFKIEKSQKNKYDLSISGYGNNIEKLGGPLRLDDKVVLKVRADKPMYLTGVVKDYYDGYAWDITENNYIKVENPKKIKYYFNKGVINIRSSIEIYPQNEVMETSTLFMPNTLTVNRIDVKKGNIYYNDIPTFMLNSIVKKPYTVEYYTLRRKLDFLKDIQNEVWSMEEKPIFTNEYKKYLEVPENISPRVRQLTKTIVQGTSNKYEKAMKIKKYLSEKYPYSLDVSVVPENQEFIDYFLFTEKKGYCVYFATAMTIMCRLEGIPARYVEGFKMTDDRDEKDLFEVTNKDAHAWCEVLISPKDKLWTIAEVTPRPVVKQEEAKTEEAEKPTNITENNENKTPTNIDKDKKDNTFENSVDYRLKLWQKISIGIGSIFIAYITIMLSIFYFRKRKILNDSSSIPLYNYCKKRLEYAGVKKSPYVGDIEFVQEIENIELKTKMRELALMTYAEFYGKKPSVNFDKKQYINLVETYIKQNVKAPKYYFQKYFLFYSI